jgi:hypothetical protein
VGQLVYEKRIRIAGHERQRAKIDFARRYEAGESIRHLANSSGRSYGFVHRLLAEADVRFRSRGAATRTPRDAGQRDD